MDYMSEGKEDEIDLETCSELSDIDGSMRIMLLIFCCG